MGNTGNTGNKGNMSNKGNMGKEGNTGNKGNMANKGNKDNKGNMNNKANKGNMGNNMGNRLMWVTRQHGQEGNKETRATGKQSNLSNRGNLYLHFIPLHDASFTSKMYQGKTNLNLPMHLFYVPDILSHQNLYIILFLSKNLVFIS